jgi:protein gp37
MNMFVMIVTMLTIKKRKKKMAQKSKIEWTTRTWNPITGCTKISEACDNCYAERMAKRFAGLHGYPKENPFNVTIHKNRFLQPAGWSKPCKVFVCSMSDLFHPNIPWGIIYDLFTVMDKYKDFTFQILTKRPKRAKEVLTPIYDRLGSLSNVWIGITAENQARFDQRIDHLMEIPAKVRFISCEPMLGAIDMSYYLNGCPEAMGKYNEPDWEQTCPPLSWVICGGESGPKARPTHPYWIKELQEQCNYSKTPFFFKQWGEWIPRQQWELQGNKISTDQFGTLSYNGDIFYYQTTTWNGREYDKNNDFECIMYRVGKKAAGAMIDGKEYKTFPKI